MSQSARQSKVSNMERFYQWLIASPLGQLLAHRVVVALLAAILGALGAVGLEFAPAVAECLEASSVSVSSWSSPVVSLPPSGVPTSRV